MQTQANESATQC